MPATQHGLLTTACTCLPSSPSCVSAHVSKVLSNRAIEPLSCAVAPVEEIPISGAVVDIRVSRIPITLLLLLSLLLPLAAAEQPAARPVADWIASGVIYEINPRTFSATRNFRGVDHSSTAQICRRYHPMAHADPPVGQEKKKGTIGSAYAVRDYYGINPDYGTKDNLKHLVAEPTGAA